MRGTVVVTSSAGTFPGLLEALEAIPVPVEECPLMEFAPPLDWRPVDQALDRLTEFDAVAVTSPRAARAFAERVMEQGKKEGFLKRPRLWAGARRRPTRSAPSWVRFASRPAAARRGWARRARSRRR